MRSSVPIYIFSKPNDILKISEVCSCTAFVSKISWSFYSSTRVSAMLCIGASGRYETLPS